MKLVWAYVGLICTMHNDKIRILKYYIMIWWKGRNTILHNYLPSLTEIIYIYIYIHTYICLCMCVNMAVKCTQRYMTTGVSFVWSRFNSYSDQYAVLRLWVIQNICISILLWIFSKFFKSSKIILLQDS